MGGNMKHIVLFVKVLLILGVLIINPTSAYAADTLQYALTHDKVKRVCVFEIKEGLYWVTVELNNPAKKVLSQLTENNIGKKMDVVISERILVSAVIKGKIDSGVISLGEWNLEEATEKIKEIFKTP
jgi:preprotein translocase subunit SecD